MILVSIIIPLYNSAAYLPKCLDSLLSQDVGEEEMEIICVDDGSPDNSGEIARRYAALHPCVRVITRQNGGVSAARNTGLDAARGKYLRFVDPDDYAVPGTFRPLLRQMEDERLDMLRFDFQCVDEAYHPIPKARHSVPVDYRPKLMSGNEYLAARMGVECYVWTWLYRREIITRNDIRCLEGDYYDDTPWLPRVLQAAQRVNSTPTVAHCYLIRAGSLVTATSPEACRAKRQGQQLLIGQLQAQMEATTDAGVRRWYRTMLSACCLALLPLTAATDAAACDETIAMLRKNKLLPMSLRGKTAYVKLKTLLFNLFPHIMCAYHARAHTARN